MSGGGVKHFFEQPAAEDSRVVAQLGRTLHVPAITAEAKHNEQNPGRAITKAGIDAALWWAGAEAGDALGAGGTVADGVNGYTDAGVALDQANAANAAMQAANTGAGLLGTSGSAMSASQLQQLALQDATDTGLLGTGSNTISPANIAQMSQSSPTVTDLSVQAQAQPLRAIQDYASQAYSKAHDLGGGLLSRPANLPAEQNGTAVYDQSVRALGNGARGSTARTLGAQMGLKMLMPQQQQQAPQGMPAPQGPQGPLTNPYQNNPYGPSGNSLGLSEAQKQKLRAMGYQIP